LFIKLEQSESFTKLEKSFELFSLVGGLIWKKTIGFLVGGF
jgi:hypothetical protein